MNRLITVLQDIKNYADKQLGIDNIISLAAEDALYDEQPENEPVMFSKIDSQYSTRLFLDVELNFKFWTFLPCINLNLLESFSLEFKLLCLSISIKNKTT